MMMTIVHQASSDRHRRAHGPVGSSRTLLSDAMQFAEIAYSGQSGEFREPAIEHPLRVMAALACEDTKIVALLHDTLLNSVATLVDLRALLPSRLLMAVTAFGHADQESDGVASQCILADPIALTVKLACIADQANPVRSAHLDPFTRRRREATNMSAARALGTTLPELLAT